MAQTDSWPWDLCRYRVAGGGGRQPCWGELKSRSETSRGRRLLGRSLLLKRAEKWGLRGFSGWSGFQKHRIWERRFLQGGNSMV